MQAACRGSAGLQAACRGAAGVHAPRRGAAGTQAGGSLLSRRGRPGGSLKQPLRRCSQPAGFQTTRRASSHQACCRPTAANPMPPSRAAPAAGGGRCSGGARHQRSAGRQLCQRPRSGTPTGQRRCALWRRTGACTPEPGRACPWGRGRRAVRWERQGGRAEGPPLGAVAVTARSDNPALESPLL